MRWIEASMTTAHRTLRTPNPAASAGLVMPRYDHSREGESSIPSVVDGAADYKGSRHLESTSTSPLCHHTPREALEVQGRTACRNFCAVEASAFVFLTTSSRSRSVPMLVGAILLAH